jgi:hypothetical protein
MMEKNLGRSLVVLCALIGSGGSGSSAIGQQAEPKPRLYLVHQEQARPYRLEAYEQATRDFHKLLADNPALLGPMGRGVQVRMSEAFLYSYTLEIDSLAEVAEIERVFARVAAKQPQRFGEIWGRGGEATEWMRDLVLVEDPALSYQPSDPYLRLDEARYLGVDVYYAQPGREDEVERLARDYVAAFRAKGVRQGYRLMRAAMGPELPMLVVMIPARDALDLAQANAESQKLLGAEGAALAARARSFTRRFERHEAFLRPDLSLPPVAH